MNIGSMILNVLFFLCELDVSVKAVLIIDLVLIHYLNSSFFTRTSFCVDIFPKRQYKLKWCKIKVASYQNSFINVEFSDVIEKQSDFPRRKKMPV